VNRITCTLWCCVLPEGLQYIMKWGIRQLQSKFNCGAIKWRETNIVGQWREKPRAPHQQYTKSNSSTTPALHCDQRTTQTTWRQRAAGYYVDSRPPTGGPTICEHIGQHIATWQQSVVDNSKMIRRNVRAKRAKIYCIYGTPINLTFDTTFNTRIFSHKLPQMAQS